MRRALVAAAVALSVVLSLGPAAVVPSTTTVGKVITIGSTAPMRKVGGVIVIGGTPAVTTTVPRTTTTRPAPTTTSPRRPAPTTTLRPAPRSSASPAVKFPKPYPASCSVTAGRASCVGWRIGDPQPYASRWWAREPVPVPLESVQEVQQGHGPGCAVVAARPVEGTIHGKDPAQVWCWGEGFEYGKGMTGRGFVPSTKPMLLWQGPDLDDMSVGYRNVCLLHDEGTVTCFGYTPRFGQFDQGAVLVEQRGLVEVDAGWTNTCMKPRNAKWFCV